MFNEKVKVYWFELISYNIIILMLLECLANATESMLFVIGVPCIYVPIAVIVGFIVTKKNLLIKMKIINSITPILLFVVPVILFDLIVYILDKIAYQKIISLSISGVIQAVVLGLILFQGHPKYE